MEVEKARGMAAADGSTKLLYVVVTDDHASAAEGKLEESSFRYTRSVLQSTLQLIGCKPRHAYTISKRVFEMVKPESSVERVSTFEGVSQQDVKVNHQKDKVHVDQLASEVDTSKSKTFEMYKRRTTVVVRREKFLDIVCEALSEYKYVAPNQRADLVIACRIQERKKSVTVLLCGTSGCGKSTLSALLGSRLGITTIVSTDSIRHMMRSFVDENENPLLWASTYHAGEYLDPVAVAEAKAKRKAKKLAGTSAASLAKHTKPHDYATEKSEGNSTTSELISPRQMAIEGFQAQSEMVIDSLDRLITTWEKRKESVVVEGVHLSLNFVMGLMKKHPSIIPFMIYISKEDKHLERFAIRAKYMTLDPAKNKYVKYIRNIRTIQEYLINRADKHLVPKINNTNVDKSVAVIHATVFSCLRRRGMGEQLYDPVTNTVSVVDEEYRNQCSAYSLSSKGMFQLIQRQGSSRQLMALLNNDGSVAKAWPVNATDDKETPIVSYPGKNAIGIPMYGPLQIGRAEPVNLQFGHFGISAFPSDTGCASRASSVDESRGEWMDNGSKGHSSCCSSPRALAKELKEESSVHASDDEVEADDSHEIDIDEDDLSYGGKSLHEELEGSVDEEYTKSDMEYEDLAMQDFPVNGGMSDDEELRTELNGAWSSPGRGTPNRKVLRKLKYQQNLDLFLRMKRDPVPEPLVVSFASPFNQKNERKATQPSANCKVRRRTKSNPAFMEQGSLIHVPNQ